MKENLRSDFAKYETLICKQAYKNYMTCVLAWYSPNYLSFLILWQNFAWKVSLETSAAVFQQQDPTTLLVRWQNRLEAATEPGPLL